MKAAKYGHSEVVKILVKAGADLKIKNKVSRRRGSVAQHAPSYAICVTGYNNGPSFSNFRTIARLFT